MLVELNCNMFRISTFSGLRLRRKSDNMSLCLEKERSTLTLDTGALRRTFATSAKWGISALAEFQNFKRSDSEFPSSPDSAACPARSKYSRISESGTFRSSGRTRKSAIFGFKMAIFEGSRNRTAFRNGMAGCPASRYFSQTAFAFSQA